MTVKAITELIPDTTLSVLPSYDQTKWNVGSLFKRGTLASPAEKYITPFPLQIHRPMEIATTMAVNVPHAIQWSTTIDWIFVADGAATAPTRKIGLYIFDRSTFSLEWRGFTTVTFPTATNHTIRGIRATYDKYTTGTASASGTAVTGSGTAWQTARLCVGNRIGFGSTDPTQIVTWYEISAVGGDTSITLTSTAGTVADGPYVIEDLRVAIASTNATAANGGLFVVKGLRYEHFTGGGTTVSAATTVDNIRACYWLADASTVTNTVALGLAADEKTDWQNQDCYVPNGTATLRIFKYNLRAALTLAAGKDTTSLILQTGNHTFTGTASQVNNVRLGSLAHGDGSGVKSLWITTTTRVYRCPVTSVTAASVSCLAELAMVETPPATTTTYAATATINNLEIVSTLDRLLVFTSGAATPFRSYLTKWVTDGTQLTKFYNQDSRKLDNLASSADVPSQPVHFALPLASWAENGILYVIRVSASATYNQFYVFPIGADEENSLAANQVVMTPVIDTTNISAFSKFYMRLSKQGGTNNLGFTADPVYGYYRLTGISDNSGAWTEVDPDGDISELSPAGGSIQFMMKWNVVGNNFVFPKLYSVGLSYADDNDMPPYYRWYLADSDNDAGIVGFIQVAESGYTVLTIRYYKVSDDSLLLEQASSGTDDGYFEYWDGDSWEAGLGSDAADVRRRFTPTAGLPASTPVYVRISGA